MVGYRQALHFCLFFFCPCLISCKFELLSRPFKLTTLVLHYVFGPRAVIRVFCASYPQRWSLQLAVIAQVGHRSWLKECDGYNSYSDAEKELNSFISSAKGSGRDWCKCRQDGCNSTAPSFFPPAASAGQVWQALTFMHSLHSPQRSLIDL